MDWHVKFGHLNERDLKKVLLKISGVDTGKIINCKLPACEICLKGKQARLPFKTSDTEVENVLDLIHTDVCGPMRVSSHNGSRYFVTFIDEKSKWGEVYFLKHKSEILVKFKEYKAFVENKFGRNIKSIRSDNGTEYKSMDSYLKQEGIRHEYSVEYTPQQNGTAERKNRTLVEMARCMLIQSNLPPSFWAEAVNTANHIRNRCPSASLKGDIPFKIWTGQNPTVKYFQKFGSIAYMLDKKPNKSKFDPRSKRCIFVGYSDVAKAFRLWDPERRRVVRSRDVQFTNSFSSENENSDVEDLYGDILIEANETKEMTPLQNNVNDEDPHGQKLECLQPDIPFSEGNQESLEEGSSDNDEDFLTPLSTIKKCRGRPRILRTGKPGRPRKLFQTIKEAEGQQLTPEEIDVVANIAEVNDPLTIDQALSGDDSTEWQAALQLEYDALIKNKTWTIVDRPADAKVIGCRWVLRTKYNANGTVERRKARLVAKGFKQGP